jgi:hypothetical protein
MMSVFHDWGSTIGRVLRAIWDAIYRFIDP